MDSVRSLWDNFKHSNIHITVVPERDEKEQEIRNLFEKVMKENCSNLVNEIELRGQKLTHTCMAYWFFKYILLIMILQLSHFFLPFIPLYPASPLPPAFPTPPLSSCPWVIHVSSLASPFPTLFLPSPCLFSTYHLCLFSVPFPPSPSHSPIDNPPCDLHLYGSVAVLVVCLVCFCFCFRFSSWQLWVCCHFTVHFLASSFS